MIERRKIQLLCRLGRDEDVLAAAGALQQLRDPIVALYRSRALHRLGRDREALKNAMRALQLSEAQALEPDPLELALKREELLRDLAQLAETCGDIPQALYFFRRYLKLAPSLQNRQTYQALLQKLDEPK